MNLQPKLVFNVQIRHALSRIGDMRQLVVNKWIWRMAVSILLALHVSKNLHQIGHREVWQDEAVTVIITKLSFPLMVFKAAQLNAQPPMYYALLNAVQNISDNEAWLRFFSWGFVGLAALFLLFGRFNASRVTRVVSVFFLIYCRPSLYMAQEIRPYAMNACFVGICLLALDNRLHRKSAQASFPLLLLIGLGMTAGTLFFGVWPVACAGGCWLIHILRDAYRNHSPLSTIWKNNYRELGCFLLVALCYIPYVYISMGNFGGFQSAHGSPPQPFSMSYYFGAFIHMLKPPQGTSSPIINSISALLLLASTIHAFKKKCRLTILLWAVCLGQVTFVNAFLHDRSFFAYRYYLPATIPFYLLLGIGAQTIWEHLRAWTSQWKGHIDPLAALTGLGLLGFLTLHPMYGFIRAGWTPQPMTPWNEVARYLEEVEGSSHIFFEEAFDSTVGIYYLNDVPNLTYTGNWNRKWNDLKISEQQIKEVTSRKHPPDRIILQKGPSVHDDVLLPTATSRMIEKEGYVYAEHIYKPNSGRNTPVRLVIYNRS